MRRWLITFMLACLLSIAFVLALLWAFNGFEGLGIGLWGTVALAGGIVCTSALGVTLMALIFASDRSDKDSEVQQLKPEKR
ncbi:MAG TPA: hypothetical protein VN980_17315 [Alphaproteobacteria bacterium]|nr:hypothetical protein [Alphaproteobacteria bacterium]